MESRLPEQIAEWLISGRYPVDNGGHGVNKGYPGKNNSADYRKHPKPLTGLLKLIVRSGTRC
jgi:hypothetical protein